MGWGRIVLAAHASAVPLAGAVGFSSVHVWVVVATESPKLYLR